MPFLIYSSVIAQWLYRTDTLQLELFIIHFSWSNAVAVVSVCVCVRACACVCVLDASVFPKESARTAAAVSPYKDVCLWKEGWRKGRKRRMGGSEGEEE